MVHWLDVTTTLRWTYRPVGIIRVESELARVWLQRPPWEFRFCRFDPHHQRYVVVPRSNLRALPSFQSLPWGNRERLGHGLRRLKRSFLRRLGWSHTGGNEAVEVPFRQSDCYLSLGLDWDDKDLALLLALKRRHGFRVVLCCYDLIPILFPQLTLPSTRDRFPSYLSQLAGCADAVLCISRSTLSDLKAYLQAQALPQPALTVFQLGTDLSSPLASSHSSSVQVQQLIKAGPFILMVSTLEARKGHDLLVRAYRRMLNSSDRSVPHLVFVGMKGWGVDHLLETIETDPLLAGSISILSGLEDADLARLYEACLFTVFPSLYEGWGLPVAESLARGKFCLASDRASLPEVGGTFCEYLDAEDDQIWAERIVFYSQNPALLAAQEARIRSDFHACSWRQTCEEVIAVVRQREQPG